LSYQYGSMSSYLLLPEFWASHYYLLIEDEEYESNELIQPFFGISCEAVEHFYSETLVYSDGDPFAEPVRLPLIHGFSLEVENADCGDRGHEERYFINHSSWEKPELLGYQSPHSALPAFRWSEIELISNALHKDSRPIEGAIALLLLFPAVWLTSGENVSSVSERLKREWNNLSLIDASIFDRLVSNIIDCTPVTEIAWWEDRELGWINDGQYSFRNPKTLMCEFAERRFRHVSEFFGGIVNTA
jgi:hypothetical protein